MMSLAEIVDDGEGRKGRGVKNVEGRKRGTRFVENRKS
jgi:hypothetical protein